jgi:hypothetical protein
VLAGEVSLAEEVGMDGAVWEGAQADRLYPVIARINRIENQRINFLFTL